MDPNNSRTLGTTVVSIIQGTLDSDQSVRREYLDRFYRQYGGPLLRHLEGRCGPSIANDLLSDFLTQKFLQVPGKSLAEKFLERKKQQPALKFRSYLFAALNNFVVDYWRKQRNGQFSLNDGIPLADESPSEDVFDVEWANHLLQRALSEVQDECARLNQPQIWDVFERRIVRPARDGTPAPDYAELVNDLGLETPKKVSNRLQTAIRKFNRILRELVENYLPRNKSGLLGDDDVQEELADLRRILSMPGGLKLIAEDTDEIEDSLSSVSPRILEQDSQPDAIWAQEDFGPMWRHINELTLEQLLRDTNESLADEFADMTVFEGARLETLADLWRHPHPPLRLLQAIKNDAKAGARFRGDSPSRSSTTDAPSLLHSMPSLINAALYAAAIAVAWVRLDTRLTRDKDQRFRARLEKMLALPWLDEAARAPLQQWLDRIVADR